MLSHILVAAVASGQLCYTEAKGQHLPKSQRSGDRRLDAPYSSRISSSGDIAWYEPADGVPLSGLEAANACASRGGRLCLYDELCPSGEDTAPVGMPSSHSDWMPFLSTTYGRRWMHGGCKVHEDLYDEDCHVPGCGTSPCANECCEHVWCTTPGYDNCPGATQGSFNGYTESCKGSYACCSEDYTWTSGYCRQDGDADADVAGSWPGHGTDEWCRERCDEDPSCVAWDNCGENPCTLHSAPRSTGVAGAGCECWVKKDYAATNDDGSGGGGSSMWVVGMIGGVLGVAVIVAFCVCIYCYVRYVRAKAAAPPPMVEVQVLGTVAGAVESSGPLKGAPHADPVPSAPPAAMMMPPPPPTGRNFCSACGAPVQGPFCGQCGARA